MDNFMVYKGLIFSLLISVLFFSCQKEEICQLVTEHDCPEATNAPTFLFKKCTTSPDIFYHQNEGSQFLFTSQFAVNLPADFTLVNIGKPSVTHQFNIPNNAFSKYWHGNYFYYLSVPNGQNNVSSQELIKTQGIFTTQIVEDKMYVFELFGGNISFPGFNYTGSLYEIDLKKGTAIKVIELSDKENAKHIYVEHKNNERILVTVLENSRYEYNDSKRIAVGEFPLNISAKILRFVYSYGDIYHYHTDKGAYFYHSKYKTSLPPDDVNNSLIDDEYFLRNNRIHRWKDLKEIENYKGPMITPSRRGGYYFYKDIISYTEDKTIFLHKFSEEKPYKTYTYCSSLNDFTGRTVLNDELYLQNAKGTQIIKVKL